jgi:hypothetical protein
MPSGNPEPQAKLPLFCQQKLQVDEVSNFYGISQIGELENAACANFLSPLIYRATSFFGMGPCPLLAQATTLVCTLQISPSHKNSPTLHSPMLDLLTLHSPMLNSPMLDSPTLDLPMLDSPMLDSP